MIADYDARDGRRKNETKIHVNAHWLSCFGKSSTENIAPVPLTSSF